MCVVISQIWVDSAALLYGVRLCSAMKLESIFGPVAVAVGSTHFGPSGKSRKGRVNNRITAFAKVVVAVDLFNFLLGLPFGPLPSANSI